MQFLGVWTNEIVEAFQPFSAAQKNNARLIYNLLKKDKWTDNAIYALLGNIAREGMLNPLQWQIGLDIYATYTGFGFVGWTPWRRIIDWLQSHGYDEKNPDSAGRGEVAKLIEELNGTGEVVWIPTATYPETAEIFKTDKTLTIERLTSIFLYNYERPADPTASEALRIADALKWRDILSGAIFKPRLDTAGMAGSIYYYSGNGFYNAGYGPNGSAIPESAGNCTWYALGRFGEISADIAVEQRLSDVIELSSAQRWYNLNKDKNVFPHGSTPELGSIACFSGGGDGGHVAVVERIEPNGDILTSNSAYGSPGSYFYTQTYYKKDGYSFGPFTFQGFIHNPFAGGGGGGLLDIIPGMGLSGYGAIISYLYKSKKTSEYFGLRQGAQWEFIKNLKIFKSIYDTIKMIRRLKK